MQHQQKEITILLTKDDVRLADLSQYHPGLLIITLVPYIENLDTIKALKIMHLVLQVIEEHCYKDLLLEGYEDYIVNYLITLPERLEMNWEEKKYIPYIYSKIQTKDAMNRILKRGYTQDLLDANLLRLEWISIENLVLALKCVLVNNYQLDSAILLVNPYLECIASISHGLTNLSIAYNVVAIYSKLESDKLANLFQKFILFYSNDQIQSHLTIQQLECFIVLSKSFQLIAHQNLYWISSFMMNALEHIDKSYMGMIEHVINTWYTDSKNKPQFKVTLEDQNKVNRLWNLPLKDRKITKRSALEVQKGWVPSNELHKLLKSHQKLQNKKDSDDDSDFDTDELLDINYLEIEPHSKLKRPAFIREIIAFLDEKDDTFKLESAYTSILPIIEHSDEKDLKECLPKLINSLVVAQNSCNLKSFQNLELALVELICKFPNKSCSVLYSLLVKDNSTTSLKCIDALVNAGAQLAHKKEFTSNAYPFLMTLINSFKSSNTLVIKRYALALQTMILFSQNATMLIEILKESLNWFLLVINLKNIDIKKICVKGIENTFQILIQSQINPIILIELIPFEELSKISDQFPEKCLTKDVMQLHAQFYH